jgi:hypothetical protein
MNIMFKLQKGPILPALTSNRQLPVSDIACLRNSQTTCEDLLPKFSHAVSVMMYANRFDPIASLTQASTFANRILSLPYPQLRIQNSL